MKKNDDFDAFLKDRFQKADLNIPDDGFSDRVISRLPVFRRSPARKHIVLLIAGLLPVIIFIASSGFRSLISSATEVFTRSSAFLAPSMISLVVFVIFLSVIVILTGQEYDRSTI